MNGEAHVGDVLILTELAPLLRARNTRLIVLSNPSLAPLLHELADVIEVIPYTLSRKAVLQRLQAATHVCPWADFYRRLRKAAATVPVAQAHIKPDATKARQLRADYQSNHERPLVGLVWRTSLIGRNPARDSALEDWVPVLTRNADFISLQYGAIDGIKADLLQLKRATGLNLWHDERICAIGQLPDYAAQIAACDAVVTIDCSTVFLSGALGQRTCTLIPVQASFRWGQSDGPCTYYPHNWLYRQHQPEVWQGPLRRVAADLTPLIESGARGCSKNWQQQLAA